MIIESPENYDLLSSVHAWIFPDIQPVPEQTSTSSFWRVFTIGKKKGGIKISQTAPGNELHIEWTDSSLSKSEIVSKLTNILNLDLNITPALKRIRKEKGFSLIFDKIKGIRPYLADSFFEALIKTIIQQQISYRAANVITQRLVLRTSNLDEKECNIFSFPTPEMIVSLGLDGLRDLGLGYKSDYVYNICEMISNKELDLETIQRLEFKELSEILIPLKGIGQWTIDVLAIASVGNFAIFPFGDLGIQNLLGRIFNDGRRLSASEVKDYSDSWGSEGPLVLYLLMCADVLGHLESFGRAGKP